MSLSQSPAAHSTHLLGMHAPPRRRLSARRGSTTAPDPLGLHNELNHNPARATSSTLTIVRVTSPVVTPPPTLHEPPSSPVLNQRRLHRRIGNNPATSPPSNEPAAGSGRLSFAFSSFSGSGPAQGGPSTSPGNPRDRAPSPSSSPRLRPSSPRLGPTSSFPSKPRLTPDQLVDLARSSTSPNTLAQIQNQSAHSEHGSPAPSSYSPVLRAHSPHLTPAAGSVQPATFTPLPDDIYLPFIERPSEVETLITTPPDVKLFSLLAQTFTKTPAVELTESSLVPTSKEEKPALPRDPKIWSYSQLIYHLTQVDRDVAPDPIWAFAARKCILSHSELIWERIKGALGIPPELDVDFDFSREEEDDMSSPNTSDISDDEGRGARGHWSDWDETIDSPMYLKHSSKRLSVESPSTSFYLHRTHTGESARDKNEDLFKAQMDDKLQGLQEGFVRNSSNETSTITVDMSTARQTPFSNTPGQASPPSDGIIIGAFSPPTVAHRDESPEGGFLSIEPLIAPSTSPSINPPPLSLPSSLGAGDGLGDIAEGAEEEEEEAAGDAVASTSADQLAPLEDPDLISPSQIQGLRISTSPLPAASGTPVLSPVSPLPPYVAPSASAPSASQIPMQPQSRSGSRASSFSSYIGPFQRSESGSNLAAARAALQAEAGYHSGYASSAGYASSDAGDMSDTPYDPVADRAPGNPLFPSNFARLALGPTLRANNPSLRSPNNPPASRYGPPHGYRSSHEHKTRAYSHGAAGVSGGPPGGLAGTRINATLPSENISGGDLTALPGGINLGVSGGVGRLSGWKRQSWGVSGGGNVGGDEYAVSASGSSVGAGGGE
ncbi:hypothetical protein BDQ12DRAFT_665099 [Crucibulum laeve]|uniref:Uncharacterized protein n=1 Tax=Crucibulum laeve TaxID=68775 RepID=A0A5C3M7Q5_9AGAR|nr:hypothetical protein BDQ12DRAFT_665099 [Crucibulum laeve]